MFFIKQVELKLQNIKALSTRIRKFLKTQILFGEYGLRPHVSSVFYGLIRKCFKTASRVQMLWSYTNSNTCGRLYPVTFEYADVIFLDPVFHSEYKQTCRTLRL